jgi:O-antigen biosynthesis protein WbqP
MGKRVLDAVLALILFGLLLPLMILIGTVIKLTSTGPILYWSERFGRKGVLFKMPKFRSMHSGAPTVATHLLEEPDNWLTPVGWFLRKSSLDELPQIWSILKGEMSFVGPRPALFNQYDLIQLREEAGINLLVPGLTGWAQINGRDELPIIQKVEFDREYLERSCLLFDLTIMWLTVSRVFRRDGVSH